MTARRSARASAPRLPDGSAGPPPELYDADAPVWHNFDLYRAWMERRGWGWNLPVSDRFDMFHRTHPANRRNYAADAWGAENGISTHPGHADWNRLREMGLIG